MILKFPPSGPVVETNKTDREWLRKAEWLLRNVALAPGHENELNAAVTIREFLDEQERAIAASAEELPLADESTNEAEPEGQ